MFRTLGVVCYGFAIVDFAGMFFGYDLTGVSWSPIAAVVLGSWLASLDDDDGQRAESDAAQEEVLRLLRQEELKADASKK